jgi:hypothetical protein
MAKTTARDKEFENLRRASWLTKWGYYENWREAINLKSTFSMWKVVSNPKSKITMVCMQCIMQKFEWFETLCPPLLRVTSCWDRFWASFRACNVPKTSPRLHESPTFELFRLSLRPASEMFEIINNYLEVDNGTISNLRTETCFTFPLLRIGTMLGSAYVKWNGR